MARKTNPMGIKIAIKPVKVMPKIAKMPKPPIISRTSVTPPKVTTTAVRPARGLPKAPAMAKATVMRNTMKKNKMKY